LGFFAQRPKKGKCFRVVDLLCSLHVFEAQHDPSDHEVL
jgi:hypothetical protein